MFLFPFANKQSEVAEKQTTLFRPCNSSGPVSESGAGGSSEDLFALPGQPENTFS